MGWVGICWALGQSPSAVAGGGLRCEGIGWKKESAAVGDRLWAKVGRGAGRTAGIAVIQEILFVESVP